MPKSSPPERHLRINTAEDLISLVPYLLGFHPTTSLVAVGLRDGQLAVTLRIDLADMQSDDALVGVRRVLSNAGASSVIVAIYDNARPDSAPERAQSPADERQTCTGRDELPYAERVALLATVLGEESIDLVDALLLSDQRYISYLCTTTGCCLRHGWAIPRGESVVAAAATYAGMVALSDRTQVGAELCRDPDPRRASVTNLIAELSSPTGGASAPYRVPQLGEAIISAARAYDSASADGTSVTITDEQVAQFALALRQRHTRDLVWLSIDATEIDGANLWSAMVRLLRPPYDAAPLFLFAWSTWRRGNCTLARIAAERALESVPSYSAAKLLICALNHSLDPRSLPALGPEP